MRPALSEVVVLLAVLAAGCSCNLPERLTFPGAHVAVGAKLDIAAADGCTQPDFRLVGDRGKITLLWVEAPTCLRTQIATVRAERWSDMSVLSISEASLIGGVYVLKTKAEQQGSTHVELDVTTTRGNDLTVSADFVAHPVNRVRLNLSCTGTGGPVVPVGSEVSIGMVLLDGEQVLVGYDYYPIDTPGMTLLGEQNGFLRYRAPTAPARVTVTSALDPSLSVPIDVVEPGALDVDLTAAQPFLRVGQSAALDARLSYRGVRPCEDTLERTFTVETPAVCSVAQATPRGPDAALAATAVGQCRVTVRTPGSARSATLTLDVRPALSLSQEPLFDAGDTGRLGGMWGSSASDVFLVGSRDGQPLVLHSDGTGWASQGAARRDGGAGALFDVWGTGPADVWAAGTLLMHYDGGAWAEVDGLGDATLSAVWGSGAADVWVAGYRGASPGPFEGRLWHFDGAGFTELPDARGLLPRALWASGPGDVYLMGQALSDAGSVVVRGEVLRFDGSSWQPMLHDGGVVFSGLTGVGPRDVLVCGGSRVLRSRDGGLFVEEPVDERFGALQASFASGPDSIYALTNGGALHRFDGRDWERISTGTTSVLIGGYSPGPAEAWVHSNRQLFHLTLR